MMGKTTPITEDDISTLLAELVPALIQHGQRLATAESCTGGWLAKCLTDLQGSSQWFDCSIVTYSNQAKTDLLGVSPTVLDDYGAVSQPVVRDMVLGLLDLCQATIGISISGIAGPDGGSEEKPVGTVWIAWANPRLIIESMRFQFSGNRYEVRIQAVFEALKGIQRIMNAY